MVARVDIDRQLLADFCRRHRIVKLAFYGSVVREDFDPQRSDVDVLAEFEPGVVPSLFALSTMQFELERMLGRPVHLCRPVDLNRHIRDEVLREAEVQYVAA